MIQDRNEPQNSDSSQCSLGDTIQVGEQKLKYGDKLQEMVDSSEFLDDPAELLKRLGRDGYILLRQAVPREQVFRAREVVTSALDKEWSLIDCGEGKSEEASSRSHVDAFIRDGQPGLLLTGMRSITHHADVKALLEGRALARIFRALFGGKIPATFDSKWVRVMGHGEFTDEHTDYYRFHGNAQDMFTCWMALGDYNVKQGTLAICEGSHLLEGYTAESYNPETKVELPPDYAKFNESATWRSTAFQAGDIVIFDIRTIHASTANTTNRFRISMDTRWQPAECVPRVSRDMFQCLP